MLLLIGAQNEIHVASRARLDRPIDGVAEERREREERDVFTVLHYTYKGKGTSHGGEGLVFCYSAGPE